MRKWLGFGQEVGKRTMEGRLCLGVLKGVGAGVKTIRKMYFLVNCDIEQ